MDTISTWGWCLFPLMFFGILALAVFAGGARRGCGCRCGSPRGDGERHPPGSAAR